jgi:hypothetical protein
MNVLSRRIKVERDNLEPLVKTAVVQAIELATNPVAYYQSEIAKSPDGKINEYLKENKKYYKWHDTVITFLIDKAGFGHDKGEYLRAINANYQVVKDSLESENLLLATLGDVKAFNLDSYRENTDSPEGNVIGSQTKEEESNSSFFDQVDVKQKEESKIEESEMAKKEEQKPTIVEVRSYSEDGTVLNASLLKSKFESESYKGMRGVIGELSESLAINQRFMFTKELFDGNSDLLSHALKSIDECDNFNQAIQLVNKKYVNELNWETETEPVQEFLLLIYRKFDEV